MARFLLAFILLALLLAACNGGTPAPITPPSHLPGTPANPAWPLASPLAGGGATFEAAQVALDARDYDRAEQLFRALVAANPALANAQLGLGNALVRLGRYDEAEHAYLAALKLDPKLAAARANLGVVYYQLQQLDRAADALKAALALRPADAQSLYLLGAVRIQQKDLAEAERLLNRAKAANPSLAEVYYGLGVVYKERGMTSEAIAAFEKFLELGTSQDPRAADFAREELKSLKGQ